MLCGILMGCGQSVSKDSLLEDYDYDGLPIWNVPPSMSTIPSFCTSVEHTVFGLPQMGEGMWRFFMFVLCSFDNRKAIIRCHV